MEAAIDGGGAATGMQRCIERACFCIKTIIRVVVEAHCLPRRGTAFCQPQVVGLGFAAGAQAMAIGPHLAIKIQYASQPGAGIKKAGASKVGVFQTDLGLQRCFGRILRIQRHGFPFYFQSASTRSDRAQRKWNARSS